MSPGKVYLNLSGAEGHVGESFTLILKPEGENPFHVHQETARFQGVLSTESSGGYASAYNVSEVIFEGGTELCVYAFINHNPDPYPGIGDYWYFGKRTITVDGDMVVDFQQEELHEIGSDSFSPGMVTVDLSALSIEETPAYIHLRYIQAMEVLISMEVQHINGKVVFEDADGPVILNGGFYAVTTLVDVNRNGTADSGDKYTVDYLLVNGNTEILAFPHFYLIK